MKAEKFIALYSGTFDPLHNGHLAIAQYIASLPDCEGVWLSVSPRNPLKRDKTISPDKFRLRMVTDGVKALQGISVTDIEMNLPRPSYSYMVLKALAARYPDKRFKLIIGADNWLIFDKWKNPEEIIQDFGLLICPRPGYAIESENSSEDIIELRPGVNYLPHAPLIDISSTEIRTLLSEGKDVGEFVPSSIKDYLKAYSSN